MLNIQLRPQCLFFERKRKSLELLSSHKKAQGIKLLFFKKPSAVFLLMLKMKTAKKEKFL